MENNNRIEVKYIKSNFDLTCIIGRYACMSLSGNGTIKLFTDDGWVELKVLKEHLQRVKQIALRDKGSLYVKIRPNGEGYILDEPLREEAYI